MAEVGNGDGSSSEQRPVVLVSAADANYAMGMTVALHSALSMLDPERRVIVYPIADRIPDHVRTHAVALLQQAHPKVTVEWLAPDMSTVEGLPTKMWHSPAMYLRLLIPTLLPKDVERVLYVDSDTVVGGDLSPLWSLDMQGHAVMAVEDWGETTLDLAIPQLLPFIDARPGAPHFNSGVLLMDLPRWREERISERTLDFMRMHGSLMQWGDQDGLNAVLKGEWGQLDLSYNIQIAALHCPTGVTEQNRARYRTAASRAKIVHYTWRRKPWHWRYSGPAGDAFLSAAVRSGWFPRPAGELWRQAHRLSHMAYRQAVALKHAAAAPRPEPIGPLVMS